MAKKKTISVDEPITKKNLRLVVGRKQKLLSKIIAEEQTIRLELLAVKQRHDQIIGALYARINELDERTFELRKLRDLLDKNMAMEDALRLLKERAQIEAEKRKSATNKQEELSRLVKPNLDSGTNPELKKLWRKLVFRYHPDLVQNENAKRERETTMQKVNDAYTRGDINTLRLLEKSSASADTLDVDVTMEILEKALVDIESSIKRTKQKIVALKRSEWYNLLDQMAEAEAEGRDMIRDLEKKLKHQISSRENNIKKLKKELGVTS